MFKYTDGSEIKVGDSVLCENEKVPGIIELIALTPEEMSAINVNEPGVMVLSSPFGRLYLPAWSLEEDPLRLVARAAQA